MASTWHTLASGEVWRGWWETDFTDIPALPVLRVDGAKAGPTLLLTGGVHGDEYEGPAAIHVVFSQLAAIPGLAGLLRGRLIGLPVIHGAAWALQNRVSPHDALDLNRCFPGEPTGTATLRLAHLVFERFVRHCDALIDLHSGGVRLVHWPLIGWYQGDAAAEKLARGFGAALHPWQIADVPGVLSYEARRSGKLALGAEWGGGAWLDLAGRDAYAAGVLRTMQTLGMIPTNEPEPALDRRPPIAGNYQTTPVGGLFVASVQLGDHVAQAAPLGQLYDQLGQQSAHVAAERPGIVAGLAHRAWLAAGERIAYVG